MAEQTLNTDMDSLLDATLDDLADMPEFKPFPPGAHKCTIKFEVKKINGHGAVEVSLTVLETLELANPEDTPLAAGDSTTVSYLLDNEYGQGSYKELMKPITEHFKAGSNRANMEAANGAEVVVVTDIRTDKKNGNRYTRVTNLQVV